MTKGNNVPPNSTPDLPDDEGSASTLKAADPEPTSDPSIQGRIPVRKSSLRPAPADYRPSARDPSTLRPMAVVRAGDVETNLLSGDIAAPAPSQPSLASLASDATAEPFALAEDYSVNETGDGDTPLMIPPPPNVPIDLIQKAHGNRHPPEEFANFARPLDHERPAHPQKAAAEISSGARRALVLSSASATASDIGQPPISNSTRTNDPLTSNRRKYSLVAVALASTAIVGAALAVMHGGHHNWANPTTQLRAVKPAQQTQLDVPKLVDAPPVARERREPVVAQAVVAQSAAVSPSASPSASAPTTTRVTLELVPIDAKVNYLGRDVTGPPFVFDIEKGHRMAVEVSRLGFATAKVVIDDKKPLVHFGMLREHRPKPR